MADAVDTSLHAGRDGTGIFSYGKSPTSAMFSSGTNVAPWEGDSFFVETDISG